LSGQSRERMWSSFFSPEVPWLLTQIRPLLHWHVASFLCIIAGGTLALLNPLILKWLIDVVILQRRLGLLWIAVVVMFLGYEGRMALISVGNYIMLAAAQKVALTLRMRLLRQLDSLSADYYDKTPVGLLMYPLKEPIEEISNFASDLLPTTLRIGFTTGLTLLTMFALSPGLTFATIPLIPIFLVTRHHYRMKLADQADDIQRFRLAANDFMQEHLSAVIPIQLLGQEKRQERMMFRLLARAVRSEQKLNRTAIWFTVCSTLAVVSAISGVIGYGGVSVLNGKLSIGSLVALYGFVTQLFDPLSSSAELYTRAQKTFASIRRVQLAIQSRPTVQNVELSRHLSQGHLPEIEFSNVEFGYARQEDVLTVPSLLIRASEHVGIAGENGAGKSTLARLIARLYDPSSGVVRVAGIDLREIDLRSLRQYVSYLSSNPVLFTGTLESNVRFVSPAATRNEIEAAIHLVGLSVLLELHPHGLHQRIGPDGCQLSGGERQRLAIARVLLQKPQVLILDEATSCLDVAGEARLFRSLCRNFKTSTLIVISHRPSTLLMFPRILTMAKGRIIQDSPNASFRSDSTEDVGSPLSTRS
jgi:ATP-binding cassette, subfamily B, bacterial MsbA